MAKEKQAGVWMYFNKEIKNRHIKGGGVALFYFCLTPEWLEISMS
jgi:hypothetical protein